MPLRLLAIIGLLSVIAHAQLSNRTAGDISLSLRRSMAGQYEFVVRNDSPQAVSYSGYGRPDSARPRFAVEVLKDGKWVDIPLGWCGTGVCRGVLPSKKSFPLGVHPGISFEIEPGEKFRVSVAFGVGDARPTSDRRVYSNEIVYLPPNKG